LRFLIKRDLKIKLTNAFTIANLYYSVNRNGKNFYSLPKILDVRIKPDKNVFVFQLPHGVDPKEVKKKEFVFRSIFGGKLEFTGDFPMTMTVYKEVHNESYPYSFEDLQVSMKRHNLPIIAGKDINGKFYSYDMTVHPHLLIAGETGSGKSVMLRAILTALIQHFRNGGLQLHLADLKRSEFHLFRHVDIVKAVMTDKKDVMRCVNWFHNQLKVRGDILDGHELAHIDEYNKMKGVQKEDYLILCIDEFSLLREEQETMNKLVDLTALGRALGIYVILSTQRPDRKVIDGLMKANLTVRYAFKHADKINSRITLGEGAKVDASQIDDDDKGKFYMSKGYHYLQSPYLAIDDTKLPNGEVILGAKSILKEYKVPIEERAHNQSNSNVIDYEGEVTESDVYDEIPDKQEEEPEDLTLFMIEEGGPGESEKKR
jgi:S-DNA-T family DNA segregation ATPase FtsK/SpoIIIE